METDTGIGELGQNHLPAVQVLLMNQMVMTITLDWGLLMNMGFVEL